MDSLKLVALDEDDLQIVSAHLQDAVMKVGDLVYEPAGKRFAFATNRFVWEQKRRLFSRSGERRRSIVHFDRVLSAKRMGLDQAREDDVLSLLAVRFFLGEAPAGTVELDFSGGAAIRLDVECIEARLTDTGAAWETSSRPAHTG
jgi:hypothetical protein